MEGLEILCLLESWACQDSRELSVGEGARQESVNA